MYLLFDIGGTNLRVAISKDKKSFEEVKVVSTPQDFFQGIKIIAKLASEFTNGSDLIAAAGGIAGPLNRDKTELVSAPHLPQWKGKSLKKELSRILKTEVFLENDAALAGLGEAVFGSGQGKGIVAYLTIGTGVGGARIVDGKIDKNAFGFEPGHQILNFENYKTLEELISGSAIEKRFGKKPYEITDSDFWEEMAKWLAIGLNNTIVHWSPDIVVLGGSMLKEQGISIERVRLHLKRVLKIFNQIPQIEKAKLADQSGLYGALALICGLDRCGLMRT
jgi:predicted NBD/HSP70 family sugar kinase